MDPRDRRADLDDLADAYMAGVLDPSAARVRPDALGVAAFLRLRDGGSVALADYEYCDGLAGELPRHVAATWAWLRRVERRLRGRKR